MKPFARARVGERVRDPVPTDRRREAEGRVDALMLDGLDPGGPIPVTPESREARRRELAGRAGGIVGPRA